MRTMAFETIRLSWNCKRVGIVFEDWKIELDVFEFEKGFHESMNKLQSLGMKYNYVFANRDWKAGVFIASNSMLQHFYGEV